MLARVLRRLQVVQDPLVDVAAMLATVQLGVQTDLGGRGEIVEDLASGGVHGGAAAMSFVDDDRIDEAGREVAVELLALIGVGDRLVVNEIDLVSGVDAPRLVERESQILQVPVRSLDGLGRVGAGDLYLAIRHRFAVSVLSVQVRLGEADPIPATPLGPIHSLVGMASQRGRVVAITRIEGDPDTA